MASKPGRPPIEEEKSSAVSIRANRPYRLALRELSRRHNRPIATLIREACDLAYGNELAPLAIFFAQSELLNVQSNIEKSTSV
jgi:hypothetical protein